MDDDDGIYALDEIGKLYGAIGALHRSLADSVEELRQRTSILETREQELRNTLCEIEDRLGRLLSERTQDRADLHDDSHIAHVGLAADYRSLVMQWMQRVARKVSKVPSGSGLEYEQGQRVASFAEYLLRGNEPDTVALISSLGAVESQTIELAESMCARACSLRSKISQIGMHHEWDFRTEISGPLDEERQEAWLNCDPADPVCLVVAPAYVVQGVVYAKQLVATGNYQPERLEERREGRVHP
jgi:hypothetical protein